MVGINMKGKFFGEISGNAKNLAMDIKNCASLPSLKYITLVRISISLWHQCIRNEITTWCKFYYDLELNNKLFNYKENWQEIEEKVLKNASTLTLPHNLLETIKEVIKTVGEQILNFLYYRMHEIQNKIDIYLENLCWTSHGTINQVKTVSLLFKNDNLSTLEKYELACSICSEKDIYYYYEQLPRFFMPDIKEKQLRLMLFWTLHIRKDHKTLYSIRGGESSSFGSNENYIYKYSLKAKNEVAMSCIYNKFPESEIHYYLVNFAQMALDENNTLCIPYLISCMKPTQIHELCISVGYPILNTFAKDWRLRCYFQPMANCVLEVIKQMDFLHAIKTCILCWHEKLINGDKCKKLLNEIVLVVKGNNKKYLTPGFELLLTFLLTLEDVETLHELLYIGNTTDKKQIIYSAYGLRECSKLVIKGRFIHLRIFIRVMLLTEKEIGKFKNIFFKKQGLEICCSLIASKRYPFMNQFLYHFQTEDQVNLYKMQLLYQENGMIISNIIKKTSYMGSNQLNAIDKFLEWAFDGCVGKMYNYKMDVFHDDVLHNDLKEQFLEQVLKLAILGEFQLVNAYLSWAFYLQEKSPQIGNPFFEKNSLDICCRLIIDKEYQLLDQFLEMFCHENEIVTFKYSLPMRKQGKIIKEIKNVATPEGAKELIIMFLNYSFEGNEEVVNSVKEIVVDQGKDINKECRDIFLKIFSSLMKDGQWALVDKYMKWAFSNKEEHFN